MVLLAVLPFCLMAIPQLKIKLKGSQTIIVKVGKKYTELGANATLSNLFASKKLDLNIDGEVNTDKIGTYTIIYSTQNNGHTKKVKRVVKVIDDEKPEIKLNGDIKLCKNNSAIKIDATVIDNYDGDITDKLEYKINDNKIYLSVVDSSLNKTELEKDISYIDSEKPVITLKGNSTINLELNEQYIESGATAIDSCSGDLTSKIKISGTVNSASVGTYQITYSVSDDDGNETTITRKVVVSEHKITGNGTIYLTFDDGPGKYTTEILNILDKYNIKATFFVTSQFTGYLDKIKDEYDRGHTVGVHTYSHKWSIYSSIDTYWNDFSKIEQIVYEKTGVHPKYFRFPGGTSNTANCKYNDINNMMETLANLMTDKGYVYFDWNVDSCDTCKKNSVNDIINTIKTYVRGNGNYIILMHDIKQNTKDALPSVIEYLQAHGYTFKKIDDTTPIKQFNPGTCKK